MKNNIQMLGNFLFLFYIKYSIDKRKVWLIIMRKILEVKSISKKYQGEKGEILAIDNVNFRVNKGEFMSIIGPSGCGKSTLLSIITGLEKKTTG